MKYNTLEMLNLTVNSLGLINCFDPSDKTWKSVIELSGFSCGNFKNFGIETSLLSNYYSETSLSDTRLELVKELQILLYNFVSCLLGFLLIRLFDNLGGHTIESYLLWSWAEVIHEHMVMCGEQCTASHRLYEIAEYTVSNWITIEGRGTATKLVHDDQWARCS